VYPKQAGVRQYIRAHFASLPGWRAEKRTREELTMTEIDRLLAEIDERLNLRTNLMNSLPVDAWDCPIPDDPATIEARPKIMQWNVEIGDRIRRLEELGVEFDLERNLDGARRELLAARQRNLQ